MKYYTKDTEWLVDLYEDDFQEKQKKGTKEKKVRQK